MESIIQIEEMFSSIEKANPATNYWYTQPLEAVKDNKIFLSRDFDGNYCLFIRGNKQSFGHLPNSQQIEHLPNAIFLETGLQVPALKILAPDSSHGNRAILYILLELIAQFRIDSNVNNDALLQRITWILEVLGNEVSVMSKDKQRALAAECHLLLRLLNQGYQSGIPAENILNTWKLGMHDFAGNDIAIEVKSTSRLTRRHSVSSLDQLNPDSLSENLYIYSIGLRDDRSSNQFLHDYVKSIKERLVSNNGTPIMSAIDKFNSKLSSYGYNELHTSLYSGISPNTTLPAKFFRVQDLKVLTVKNFKGEQLPHGISNVRYDLEITNNPIDQKQEISILDALLS